MPLKRGDTCPRSRSPRPSKSPEIKGLPPAKAIGPQSGRPRPPKVPPPRHLLAASSSSKPAAEVQEHVETKGELAAQREENFEAMRLESSVAAGDEPPIQLNMGAREVVALKGLLNQIENTLGELVPEERRSARWQYERLELAAAMVAQKLHNWVVRNLWKEQCTPCPSQCK